MRIKDETLQDLTKIIQLSLLYYNFCNIYISDYLLP